MTLFNNGIPRNMPTFEIVRCIDCDHFLSEKRHLISTLEEFSTLAADGELPKFHQLFGKMTKDDWGFLEYKHLHHHLKQFNV